MRFSIIDGSSVQFLDMPDIGHVMVYFRACHISAIAEGVWFMNYTTQGVLHENVVVVRIDS